ncbi:retrovirus-related pol polyprotein from transposon TNT 1-94 [Tanacetum coccineum]
MSSCLIVLLLLISYPNWFYDKECYSKDDNFARLESTSMDGNFSIGLHKEQYSGTAILQGLWGMVTIRWEILLSQEYTTSREGVDLLSGSRDTNVYTISLDDKLKTSPICLLSKASKTKSWLWHHLLSHLNFGTLNKLANDVLARRIPRLKFQKDHLCSACALGKSKKSSHQPKAEETNQEKLYLLHMGFVWPDAMWPEY